MIWWTSARRSVRMRRRRKFLSQATARSTGQRTLPRPEPCSTPRRAMVVPAVGVEPSRPASWFADYAADRWDGVERRDELGDAVAMAAGQRHGGRGAVGVGDQVVLGAGFAAVDRAGPGVIPPLRARRCVESTSTADRSSRPAARSSASRRSCSCCRRRPRAIRSAAASRWLRRRRTGLLAGGFSRCRCG